MTSVLFLSESFHPVLGGGEVHLLRLGSALAKGGDEATVVTRRGEPSWPAAETLEGVRVVRVPPSGASRRGKFLMVPAAMRAVVREARRHDVLVVRGTRVLGLPGLLAGRGTGLAVVLQPEVNGELSGEALTWGKAWADGAAGRLVRRGVALRNLWLRDADAWVAMSRRIREEMVAAGVPEERVALIPHGVDTARFRPATPAERAGLREALGLPRGVLAVYTGRLLRGKGLETLLESFATAATRVPELQLVLVGSGEGQFLSIEDELRGRVAGRELGERVHFAGRVERVENWLRAADFFVFPSVYEALGIALVEAAACGLAAIGSRTGGIVDVIEENHSGLLVPPADAMALAAAIEALGTDEDARRSMGEKGRGISLARFDERDGLARYRGLFREVSSRRRASCRREGAARAGEGPPP